MYEYYPPPHLSIFRRHCDQLYSIKLTLLQPTLLSWKEKRYFYLLRFDTSAGPPQQCEPITVGMNYELPNQPCQVSLREETGVPGFLYSFHMGTGFLLDYEALTAV